MIRRRHPAAILSFMIGCLWMSGTSMAATPTMKAESQYKQKDYASAISLAKQAISENSKDLAAYKILVKANRKVGQLGRILNEYANQLIKAPDDAVMQFVVGYIYDLKGNSKRAERGYNKALNLDPELPMANYNIGFLYVERKEPNRAIFFFEKELEINPDYADVYVQLGRVYYKLKQYPKAVKILKKILAKYPRHRKANNLLGFALYDMGKRQEALNKWRSTVKIDPQDIESGEHNVIGLIYNSKGLYHNAIKEFQKGIKKNSKNARIYNNLGIALMRKVGEKTFGRREKKARGVKYINAAVDAYKKALEINSKYAVSYLNLGEAYEARGQTDNSLEAFEKYVGLRPSDIVGLNRLGLAYKLQGRYEDAVEAFKNAAKRSPKDSVAYRNLGEVYYYQGKQEAALKQWDISLELNPLQPILKDRINTGFWKGK